ncbi:MAG: tetratricopeptide repeat protein [Myxococcota bacterium]
MARRSKQVPSPTSETLREIEESGDRVAEWAGENAALILGVIAAILVLAGGVGVYLQGVEATRDEAADALAIVTSQYRQAMGADPIGGPIPEPANPEIAERTRAEFAERFAGVAAQHAGSTAAAVAWLETGHLQTQLGRLEAAAESFARARDEAKGSAIEALGSLRLAGLAEDRGDYAVAAESYERAASVAAYPLRANALAQATRCWASAGDTAKALAVYQQLEASEEDGNVAPQVKSLVAELRAGR